MNIKINELAKQITEKVEQQLNLNKPKPIFIYHVAGTMDRFQKVREIIKDSLELAKQYHILVIKSSDSSDRFELFNSDKVLSIEIEELKEKMELKIERKEE